MAETAVARLAMPVRPLDICCCGCAETCVGAELSRDMVSVSIGAVGIMDAIAATPSTILSGSWQRSVSGGGVGPDGGQGGSGYDVDASLTVCGASDERALPASSRLGLMVGVDGGMDGVGRNGRWWVMGCVNVETKSRFDVGISL